MTDTDDEPTRYVLHPLPSPSLDAAERQRQRGLRRGDLMTVVLMGVMMVLSVGLLAYEIAFGTFSTVMSAALLPLYALLAAWRSWTGSPGIGGRYHLALPAVCAMSLEDAEREVYRRKAEGVVIGGVEAADTAEYLRLRDVIEREMALKLGAWDRIEAITGAPGAAGRDGANDPHVE